MNLQTISGSNTALPDVAEYFLCCLKGYSPQRAAEVAHFYDFKCGDLEALASDPEYRPEMDQPGEAVDWDDWIYCNQRQGQFVSFTFAGQPWHCMNQRSADLVARWEQQGGLFND